MQPSLPIRLACLGLIVVSISLLNAANAQTQIHKCTDADGNVAYSQLPCVSAEPVEPEKAEPEPQTEAPAPEPALQEVLIPDVADEPPESSESKQSKAACKKHYRDAIDAIDAEIGQDYSPDKAEQYKKRLLTLTRELRRC